MNATPPAQDEPASLAELLDRMASAGDDAPSITLEQIVEAVGRRSFGPLLLLAGLVIFSPLSGIPGLPTVMAVFVLLIAGQLLCRRRYFWLPRWLLDRRVPRKRFNQAVRFLRRPAAAVDRLLRPRLAFAVSHLGLGVILVLSVAMSLAMPVLEFLPFSSSVAGAAMACFGLALIAHDGLLALLAIGGVASGCGILLASLL
jgi:hypothetical protein